MQRLLEQHAELNATYIVTTQEAETLTFALVDQAYLQSIPLIQTVEDGVADVSFQGNNTHATLYALHHGHLRVILVFVDRFMPV